jgi:dipeptidase E
MVQLFLSGGGHGKQSEKIDDAFAKAIPKGKRMLYIPIAMDEHHHSFGECHDFIKITFKRHKLRFDMWTDLSNRNYEELKKYGGVYIGGGNTYYLLHEMKRTGFDKLLQRYATEGHPIYGGSAGAIIFGKHIGTAADKNEVKLKDLSGLDMAHGYAIGCHLNPKKELLLKRVLRRTKIPIIALPEEAGLIVSNHGMWIIGYSNSKLLTVNGDSVLKREKRFS